MSSSFGALFKSYILYIVTPIDYFCHAVAQDLLPYVSGQVCQFEATREVWKRKGSDYYWEVMEGWGNSSTDLFMSSYVKGIRGQM